MPNAWADNLIQVSCDKIMVKDKPDMIGSLYEAALAAMPGVVGSMFKTMGGDASTADVVG